MLSTNENAIFLELNVDPHVGKFIISAPWHIKLVRVEWGKSAGIKVPYLYRNVAIFVFCFLPSSGATKGLAEWIINAALTFIVLLQART